MRMTDEFLYLYEWLRENKRKKRLNAIMNSACFFGHHRRVAKHTAWSLRRDGQGRVGKEVQEVGTSPNGTDGTQGERMQEIIRGIVETGNNVHTRAARLQLILFSKDIGAF